MGWRVMFPKPNGKSSAVIPCRLIHAQKCNVVKLWLKFTVLLITGDMCMNVCGFVLHGLIVWVAFYPKYLSFSHISSICACMLIEL